MSRMTGAPRFEAALNLLREQRRAVADVRRQVMGDEALKAEDPSHRRQLLVQTMAELNQLSDTITVLERVAQGLPADAPPAEPSRPRVASADLPPIQRVSGLAARPALPVIGRLA